MAPFLICQDAEAPLSSPRGDAPDFRGPAKGQITAHHLCGDLSHGNTSNKGPVGFFHHYVLEDNLRGQIRMELQTPVHPRGPGRDDPEAAFVFPWYVEGLASPFNLSARPLTTEGAYNLGDTSPTSPSPGQGVADHDESFFSGEPPFSNLEHGNWALRRSSGALRYC